MNQISNFRMPIDNEGEEAVGLVIYSIENNFWIYALFARIK